MAGFRIHHPTLRSCVVVIPHPGDPRTGRRPKDYQLTLDSEGDVIVSETVWRRLMEARGSGLSPHEFVLLNEVTDPPPLLMAQVGTMDLRRSFKQLPDGSVVDDEIQRVAQKFAPRGVTPRITAKDE